MNIKHVRQSEITFFKDYTHQKYADLPEGSQMVTSTMCLVLMRLYYKNRLASQKWWRKLFFLFVFLGFLSCDCLTQIPTQVLYVDTACMITVPDYTVLFRIRDNCTNYVLVQFPPPGSTFVDQDNFSVDIMATDSYGNSSSVTFNVLVIDTIAPVLQYIGDTTITYHRNEIDQLFDSVDAYRAYLNADPQDEIIIRRLYIDEPVATITPHQ